MTAPRTRPPFAFALALAPALLAAPARADEGQWTPEQVLQLDREALAAMGLELPLEQLWSGNTGLMRAAVNLSGCSAAFISAEGLIATNHHCAHGAIQANSSVEHDYLKDGFVARERSAELPAKGTTVRVVMRIDDVTREVLADAAGVADDHARFKAIDLARKKVVEECERSGEFRCEVATFYGGSEFRRFSYRELRDVRIVYAPPAAIGEFGGDIDNWMWPRHTGDFTLLRAYAAPDGRGAEWSADNVPYRPDVWLKVASEGVAAGDFVGVLGYPGNTERYLPLAAVERYEGQIFPARIDLFGEWVRLLEELGAADAARAIKVASTKKSLANRLKNARGMLAGFAAMGLLERRRREEVALEAWVKDKPEYADVLPQLRALNDERRASYARDFLVDQLPQGPGLLTTAVDLVRRARERARPDLERPSNYMDRNAKRLWDRIERRSRDFDAEVEAHLLASVLARAAALPEGQRLRGLSDVSPGPGSGRDAFLGRARALVAGSELSDPQAVRRLFDAADAAALERSRDPLVALAWALAPDLEAIERRGEAWAGRGALLGPRYFAALRAVRQGPVYPDANGTLRFSYATIRGYVPQEGLVATPQTTLRGQLAKLTGEAPFALPERVLAAAPGARDSYWADPVLGDLPLCFLASADTTGGNSGSPVINGRGELVGLNFDRVWENIAGDFGYSDRSRNVIVDVRYLLWLLDKVEDAGPILDELGVGSLRAAGPRSLRSAGPPAAAEGAADAPDECAQAPRPRRGCGCQGTGEGAPWGLLGALALVRRRRRW